MNVLSLSGWFGARFDGQLSAIVIKEARQAVRSRFVASMQLLLLGLLMLALGAALLRDETRGRPMGQECFQTLRLFFHAMCVLGVPLYVGVRLAAERSEANTDLLFSTTISPWSVVAGKLVSGLMLGLLAVSACAPFMVLCYFLRGVALGEIASAMVAECMLLLLATMLGLFIGALPVGAPVKVVAALAYAFFAVGSFRWTALSFVSSPRAIPAAMAAAAVVPYLVGFSLFGLVFFLTVAMISPHTANRAFPVRLYLVLTWVLSAALGVLLNFAMISGHFKPFKVWVVSWSVLLAIATLVAIGERDRLGPRIRAQITTLNGKVNAASLMLFSGAASGLFFVAVMTVATLVFCVMSSYSLGWLFTRSTKDVSGIRELVLRLAVANAMTLGYALLAGCIRRKFWPQAPTRANGFLAGGIIVAATAIPPAAVALLRGAKGEWTEAFIGFPFTCALDRNLDGATFAMSAVLAAVLLGIGSVWSVPWLFRQFKVFKDARPMSLGAAKAPAPEQPDLEKEDADAR